MLDGDPDVVEAGRTVLQREGYTIAMAPTALVKNVGHLLGARAGD